MFKPSHKRCKTQALKRMLKLMHRNSLNETNLANIFFAQSEWALAGSPCFDFSFELSTVLSLSDWGTSS